MIADALPIPPPAAPAVPAAPDVERLRVVIRGAVQGVGFRPFVYRLATERGLAGWVCNGAEGVVIEVEGPGEVLREFLLRIEPEAPPRAFIQSLESAHLDPVGYEGFTIRPSTDGPKTTLILPDVATCPDCLAEVLDPDDRRYRYPFTNCTHCGPRYSIIEALPYDRAHTSMRRFTMCPACQAEYDDPRDRRFHAQPNACPVCGPHLALWTPDGTTQSVRDAALVEAAEALQRGAIVAVKGLGGFHLMVDARDADAVRRLRDRKHREEKPFAVMMPSLDAVEAICHVSDREARLLRAPEAPIVLLDRRADADLAHAAIAPDAPTLGVMLPYTPLHHLLLRAVGGPVVATSGNRTDEPICIDEHEALRRLHGIADLFLVHDRPIVRHVDDSVARVVLGREMVLRRARGYAPLPVDLTPILDETPRPTILAVGGHLKNTIALSVGPQAFVSQHIGDLETRPARDAFARVIDHLETLYDATPDHVACDQHPDYVSTQHARAQEVPVTAVQHHYAHVLAAMAENQLRPPVVGIAWDGTGYGTDGTVWGGEILRVTTDGFERAAHLHPFLLPGGEAAVKEPRRSALGLLHALDDDRVFEDSALPTLQAFTDGDLDLLRQMMRLGLRSPTTTSAGRLFDGVASLVGLRQQSRFEGQAAMLLEYAVDERAASDGYPFQIAPASDIPDAPLVLDWRPMVWALLDDVRAQQSVATIATRFHDTLVAMIVEAARRLDASRVVLTGGCFQNRYLTEATVHALRAAGVAPYWHQRIPPNDGGISLGQLVAALRPSAPVSHAS
ncbi:MAG: carbamoyltransferase HypF [Bacteroidetes bacterium]|jgi:hydrogenase maturation protein HypF|nr:carbamoyltransferase HypF [Bacteroidota bacterium]